MVKRSRGQSSEAPQLPGDRAAGFSLPLPHALDEPLAAEIAPVDALLGQQPLHHHLRRDAGMIRAGLPEHVAPLHPAPADQRVLHGEGQRVAHVQAAGHVRRRDHDRVGSRIRIRIGGERPCPLPALIQAGLDLRRRIGLVQHHTASVCGPTRDAARGLL
jgi:hypothetical protein